MCTSVLYLVMTNCQSYFNLLAFARDNFPYHYGGGFIELINSDIIILFLNSIQFNVMIVKLVLVIGGCWST